MAGPRTMEPPRCSDLEALEPVFMADVHAFLADLVREDLPLWVFETRRSLARQAWLHGKGVSRAGGTDGPHPWGLAIDIVLDPRHPSWPSRGGGPIRVGNSGASWDTGVEVRSTATGTRCVVLRQGVHDVVARMGAVAIEHGLDWGGANAGGWASARKGDPFGFDPCHVQRLGWRALIKTLPSPT